jgi:hypothetical protein
MITTFWWIFPIIGFVMWFIVMQMARTITNRVLYIRKGGTMSFHKCVIQGTNIKFKPEPSRKAQPVTAHIEAQPYVYVKGMNTLRVYVITEGGGKTVAFPVGAKPANVSLGDNPAGTSSMAAAASISLFERWTTHLAEHLPKTKGEYLIMLMYIIIGVAIGLAWGMLAVKAGWI